MTIRTRVVVALAILLACLVALIGIAGNRYEELVEAQEGNTRTHEILLLLRGVEDTLNADAGLGYCAVTGSRIFVHDPSIAVDYDDTRHRLELLLGGNELQRQRLARLDAAWQRWQNQYVNPMRRLCEGNGSVVSAAVSEVNRIAGSGKVLQEEIRANLIALESAEQSVLDQRQQNLGSLQTLTAGVLSIVGLVTLFIALTAGLSLVRAAAQQDRLNRELEAEVEQRRIAERRLTNSEMRIRAVLNNIPDGIISTDGQGFIQSYNSSAEKIFGYRPESVIGKPLGLLIPEQIGLANRELLEIAFGNTGKSAVTERRELIGRRLDGGRFPIELALSEIHIDQERIFTGIVRDLSETKRQSEQINRFKAMLDNTLDMIMMFDPVTLQFVYSNKGAIEGLGYAREELMAMRASDLTPAMPEHVFRSHIAQLLTGSRPWLSFETAQLRKDGGEVPVEVFLQLVRGDPQDPPESGLFVTIARDLTERRRVDKMKGDFISIVSHELRTPLTSIRGSLGLLVGGAAGPLPERANKMVEIAYNNSERLVRLINDMLDMEKIESGKMRFDMRPLDVETLLGHALDANRGYGQQWGVEFVSDLGPTGLHIFGDSDRLIQVLSNLMSNAAKFSPKGATVRLSVRQHSKMVRISVHDQGPGIPDEFREHVFQRFSQADTSDARQKGGTGLGLSICKTIVERHDGLIGFDSESGAGTTFWFELPEWERPNNANTTALRSPARILVCEGQVDTATMLEAMLIRQGYHVDVARDAGEVKRMLAQRDYSLMTLDIQLPGQDGLSLIREIRGEDGSVPVPVIVVSGSANSSGQEVGGGHAILDWLEKPVDPARLLEVVRRSMRPAEKPIRVLHVEDDQDVQRVLGTLMGDEVTVTAVGTLGEGLRAVSESDFDLVVLDIGLPDASGLELLEHLSEMNAITQVLVFSAHDPSPELTARVGAALVKSRTSNQQLLDTIRKLVA